MTAGRWLHSFVKYHLGVSLHSSRLRFGSADGGMWGEEGEKERCPGDPWKSWERRCCRIGGGVGSWLKVSNRHPGELGLRKAEITEGTWKGETLTAEWDLHWEPSKVEDPFFLSRSAAWQAKVLSPLDTAQLNNSVSWIASAFFREIH